MIKVLDFYAKWCSPCKTMLPIFDELKLEFPDYEFDKIDIDESDEAAKYGISSVPTFVILKNGVEVSRKNGIMTKDTFKTWLSNIN
jgi:thioredoxin 1